MLFALGFVPLLTLASSYTAQAETLELDKNYKHITFKDIKPTQYTFKNNELRSTVRSSSSALLYPFRQKRKVKKLSFQWKSTRPSGKWAAKKEKTKSGDDASVRVGILLSGKKPLIPFFAPSWVKAVRDTLKLPSDKMIYFLAGAATKEGHSWTNPYSSSIQNISIPSILLKNGWRKAKYVFPQPVTIVGVWLMSDGDNTKSSFQSTVKNIRFK